MRARATFGRLAVLALTILPGASTAFGGSCPQRLGQWAFRTASSVAVSGDTAHVGAGSAVLGMDVSDPTHPTVRAQVLLASSAVQVALAGSRLYVADWDAGLRVVDVTDPSAPVEVGSHGTPGIAWDVAVSGELALVADHQAGLQVTTSCEVVFMDGFEVGDATAWSFVEP